MPTLLRLSLLTDTNAPLPLDRAPAQGWFLALVDRVDPDAAVALHAPNAPRTYAVAPLHAPTPAPVAQDFEADAAPLTLPERARRGEALALRIALADDALARRILDALPRLEMPRLSGAPTRLTRTPSPDDPHDPDILRVPWPALAAAPPATRLQIAFVTPTVFSSQGEDLLLPEPQRLVESWRRAWDAWSGGAVPLPDTPARLRISRYQLRTEALRLKGGFQRGFVGHLDADMPPDADETQRRALTALAGLANLAGTGARTALGMGQTRAAAHAD